MNHSAARSDTLTLAFFWVPVLAAWGLVFYRLDTARDVTFWAVSGVLLVLYLACVVWLTFTWQRLWRLQRLPWYLVIGPSGAGKSTLLKRSGFPWEYPAPEAARLVEAFFGADSLVLSELGGYVVYSHDDPPYAIRQELVKQLTEYLRKRKPRATIVALPLGEASPEANEARARSLRAVLGEITHQLGTSLPVYLVFTHCDQLPGFGAFGTHLSPEERDGAWGASLTAEQQRDVRASFQALARTLTETAQARLLRYMVPRDAGQSWAALHFPFGFWQACEAYGGFVATLFAHSAAGDDFLLRGVYFAAGTTDDPEPRNFFVRGLLAHAIGADAPVTRATDRAMRRLWAWRMVLSAGAAVVAAALVLAFGSRFRLDLLIGR